MSWPSWFSAHELSARRAGGIALILCGVAMAVQAMPSASEPGEATPAPQTPQPQIAKLYSPAAASRAAEPTSAFPAPVVVTVAQRPSEPPAPAPQRVAVPRDRDALARELQKELRRVGCYEGELNGAWTPLTRRAMKAFTDRINATLPVEEPDAILYTLVQGQQDEVCSKPCPVGQGLSEDGRCLPSAILGKASRKGPAPATSIAQPPRAAAPLPADRPAPVITGWTTTTATAPPPPLGPAPTEGRMALAGPKLESEALDSPSPVAPSPIARPPAPARTAAHKKRSPEERATSAVRAPQQGSFASMVFRRNDSVF